MTQYNDSISEQASLGQFDSDELEPKWKNLVIDLEPIESTVGISKGATLDTTELTPRPKTFHSITDRVPNSRTKVDSRANRKRQKTDTGPSPVKRRRCRHSVLDDSPDPSDAIGITQPREVVPSAPAADTKVTSSEQAAKRTSDSMQVAGPEGAVRVSSLRTSSCTNSKFPDTALDSFTTDQDSCSSGPDETDDPYDPTDADNSSWHPSDNVDEDDEDFEIDTSSRFRRRSLDASAESRVVAPRAKRKCRSSLTRISEGPTEDDKVFIAPSVEEKRDCLSEDRELVDSVVPESDDYCWMCHRVGQMVICSCCPRVYHPACLHMDLFPDMWLCPECQDLTIAECLLYQQPNWKNISKEQLQIMLRFLIDRLSMQRWAEHFREPVDTKVVAGYSDIIYFPMDLRTLNTRNDNGRYASTQSFLSDFRWILHNCIAFNGSVSPLTCHARLLERTCIRELTLMRACPTCYLNRVCALDILPSTSEKLPPISKTDCRSTASEARAIRVAVSELRKDPSDTRVDERDPWWFCKLCDTLHPLVWVRLQHYPRWPAKIMTVDGESILVMFFGDYDLTMAPTGSAQMHSKAQDGRSPAGISSSSHSATGSIQSNGCSTSTTSTPPPISPNSVISNQSKGPAVDSQYKRALVELDYHLSLIYARYPDFKLPPNPVEFKKRYAHRYYKRFGATTSSQWCSAIRSASSLSADRQPSLTLKADPPSSPSNPLAHVESCDNASCSSAPPYEATRSSTILLAPSVCDDPKGATPVDFPQPKEAELHDGSTTTWVDGTPNVTSGSLHPIAELAPVESAVPDKVRSLFDSLRSHFNNALDTFADQWQTSQSFIVSSSHLSSKHLIPTPGRLTLDKAIQSDLPESDSVPIPKADAADLRPIAASQSKNDETVTSSALIPLQVSMMEAEIDRLDRENRRLNLLLAFTRTEMAMDARHRIMELRRVWDSEVSVVLEAASKMWEQDVIKVVDAVKRKQWCAYCGRLAYYYCCWNTCYCNGICQSKHWATHINSCVQARSHTGANTGESDSLPRHQKHTPSTQVPNPTARSVLTPHSSSNPHWLNLNGS